LTLVPKGHKKNAKILLNEFDQRGSELTWNSDGVIFINQVSVPGSNIFEIFPFVFKSFKPKSVPGLLEFVTKIEEMGLQNLIVLKSSLRNNEVKKDEITSEKKSADKWWFLN
jgi:hypothetical protein